jgi:hypothetical protein
MPNKNFYLLATGSSRIDIPSLTIKVNHFYLIKLIVNTNIMKFKI